MLNDVLKTYGIEPVRIDSAGGTAGKAWRVSASDATYFVRRRGVRTAGEERVRFDHGLRQYLHNHGFNAFPPIPNRDGIRFMIRGGHTYEVYPWIDGRGYAAVFGQKARGAAARTLARFHDISDGYAAPFEPVVDQFSMFPVFIEPRARMDDPGAFLEVVDWVLDAHATPENKAAVRRARDRVLWLGEVQAKVRDDLPQAVIHGDYNCSNLLFHENGDVAGVFDFDWARRDVRVRDIADLVFFFGATRLPNSNVHDIWSLTACPVFEPDGMADTLRIYHEHSPLTAAEQAALPAALLARWVSCRTEGLIKVPEDQRVRFLLADFDEPFRWHDRLGDAFAAVFTGGPQSSRAA